jgi:hypothetical protein
MPPGLSGACFLKKIQGFERLPLYEVNDEAAASQTPRREQKQCKKSGMSYRPQWGSRLKM